MAQQDKAIVVVTAVVMVLVMAQAEAVAEQVQRAQMLHQLAEVTVVLDYQVVLVAPLYFMLVAAGALEIVAVVEQVALVAPVAAAMEVALVEPAVQEQLTEAVAVVADLTPRNLVVQEDLEL
jgi:hypothetical protein